MRTRATIDVGGVPISYLTAGQGGPLVLLLRGTYWSRVWQPVLEDIGASDQPATSRWKTTRVQ
jgi:hypothetical protein